ncbi:FimD/PapC N-terminal domain-containing protein, partial [Serratia proteamaculans]
MDNPSLIAFPSRPRLLGILVSIILGGGCYYAYAEDTQFNTDVLDVKDRNNIDLDQFSRGGYIMPGDYSMKVRINK